MEMIFLSHANKTHCLKKGCTLSLNLKVRAFGTRNLAYWELRCTQGASTSFPGSLSCSIGYLFLDFLSTVRLRNPKKDLKNGIAHARIISKKKTAVHENSFVNPFPDFPIEQKQEPGNPWNPDLNFLIEIHPVDGFQPRPQGAFPLEFWISKSKSGFPNRTQPEMYSISKNEKFKNYLQSWFQ